MTKPCFADEHFVQTTLAAAGLEDEILPVSLTFAQFGRANEYTVPGRVEIVGRPSTSAEEVARDSFGRFRYECPQTSSGHRRRALRF